MYIRITSEMVYMITYIGEESVDEVAVDDDSVHATKRDEEEKSCKVGVVTITNARVDPRTMVVHLHYASAKRS